MQTIRRLSRTLILLLLVSPLCLPPAPHARATQQDEEQVAGTRDIQAVEAVRGRRPGNGRRPRRPEFYVVRRSASRKREAVAAGAKKTRRPPAEVQVGAVRPGQFPLGTPPKGKTFITLGITVWRVRPAAAAGGKARENAAELMTVGQEEREYVVTRLSDDEPLAENDLIQISVEYLPDVDGDAPKSPPPPAYLYVVNREQFGASPINARLIFPTRATYEGDNRLFRGKIVTLPDPSRPFRIKRGDEGGRPQSFEVYTFVLSPVPLTLPGELGRRAMELPLELVGGWEQRWSADVMRADLRGGVGRTREPSEASAGGNTYEERSTVDTAEDLTRDDPPPQTIFRRVANPGEMMLVTIKLPFKLSTAGR